MDRRGFEHRGERVFDRDTMREITVRSDGYYWKGLTFLWSSQRTSPDGRCHLSPDARHNTGLSDLHHARRNVINSVDKPIRIVVGDHAGKKKYSKRLARFGA